MVSENRIYKFDNIKFICILLVVVGHMIDEFTDRSGAFRSLFLVIYSFHMPMFLFISGLFQKPFAKGAKFCLNKFTFYLTVGFALKLLTWLVRYIDHKDAKISWLQGADIPWFMMVLAICLLIAWLISKIPLKTGIVLAAALLLSGICGYFRFIGDFLWLSRLLVFLPFFLAGYYLTPQQVIRFTGRLWVRISACMLSLFYVVLCFWKRDLLYPLRGLFTGRNAFSRLSSIPDCGILHRYLCTLITVILCIALISIVPDHKIPMVTHMGGNTLAVFFWHRIVIYIFDYAGLLDRVVLLPKPAWMGIVLFTALLLGFVLMLDPFSWPLRKLSGAINGSRKRTCIILLLMYLAAGVVLTISEGIKI